MAKFWELQGSTLKIPLVEKRALDLYTLRKYVKNQGGMEVVTQEKKWQKVANEMGFNPQNKNIASLLKAHYERILYPLEVFEQQEEKKNQAIKEEIVSNKVPFSPEPGISGLEKTAPSGEIEFSTRSNYKNNIKLLMFF